MMKKSLLIFLVIASFTSNYFVAQNIIAETFNHTGGPYPKNNMCPSNSKFIGVKVTNKGPGSLPKNTLITITVKITAPNTTTKTFTEKFSTPSVIAFENSDWFTFVSPANIADLSKQGAYDFAIAATYASDTPPTSVDGFDVHQALYVAGNVLDLLSVSPDRSLCKSAELDTIKYEISYNADSAYASNLPPGVFAFWKLPILKIFGKPTTATNSPYTYTVRATGACSSTYDSILTGIITVKELPTIAYTGSNLICEGFSSSASPTFGGTWISSKPNIASISNGGSILGLSPGKTKLYFKTNLASACSDTLPEFTVNPLPIVDPIAGPTKVCVNAKIQLTNTNKSGTWTSLDPARATINAATGEVTGVADGPCSIEYMVVSLGCTTLVTKVITVNKLPTVVVISGVKLACVGNTTSLSNGTPNGIWSSGTPTKASISAQGLVTGVSEGSSVISYTVTDGNGCSKSDTTTVRIYGSPSVSPVISGTKTICQNDSTVVSNTTPSGVWSSAKTTIATIDANGKVKGIAGGQSAISYTVTKNGCSTTVTDIITVNPLPVVASITGSTNVCVGSTSQLANTTPGGVWTSVTPAVATINSSGLVSGLTPGTSQIDYTVTILGCSTTKSTTVNTFSIPTVNPITGVTTLCAGATTLLANTTPNGVWSSANQSVATISSQGIVTGISAGASVISYSLTLNGCSTTSTATLTVNSLPFVPAITGGSSLCIGATTVFSNTTSGGTWSSNIPGISSIDAISGKINGVSAGSATISYLVTQSGCSKTVTKTVTVNPLPVVASVTGSTNICIGATSQLMNTTPGGIWTSTNQSVATISSQGIVTGISAGVSVISYSLTLNGCTTTSIATLTVNSLPIVSAISSSGGTNICPTKTSQMSATPIGGVWTSPASSIVSINDKTGLALGVAKGSSIITYTVTSAEGCISDKTYTLSVDEAPTVAAILGSSSVCKGETTTLTCTTSNGTWSSASPSVASVDPNTGKVTGIKAEDSTIIAYTVLLNNCSTSSYFKIKVNPMPTVNPISGGLTVCSGKTTALSNTTPGGVWSSTYVDTATISATGIVTGIKGGKTEIKYAVTSKGCTTTQKATVTVVNSPIVSDITGSTAICVNSTSLLTNSSNNGIWRSDSTKYATISTTGVVTGVFAGTSLIRYAVTLNGCTTEKTTTVTIKPLPVVEGITGPTNVCVGENISLTNTTKLGQWSSSDNSIASVNGAGVVTGVKGGAVTINYTFTSGGCSNASSSPIAVNNLPTVAPILGTTTFCSGLTSKLSCTPLGGTWSSGNTSVVTVDKNGIAFGVTQGTSSITYTVIDNGCTSKSLVNVLINQTPEVAEIIGNSFVCIGSTMNLQCITQGGTWASESTGVATIDQTGLIKSVGPGTSIIAYTKTVGACTNKKTDTITVYAMPVVAKISGKFDICAGLSTTLKNDTVGGIWSSSKPQIAIIDGFGKLTGVTAGSAKIYYAVTKNGCTTTDSVTVNVTGALQVSPITGNTTICENATTDLKNTTPNGTWSSSSDVIATINSNTGVVTGIKSGQATITYSVVTNGVCPQLAQTTVIVNAPPIVSEITGNSSVCQGSTTLLSNATPGGTWKSDTLFVATIDGTLGNLKALNLGATNISYSVTQMGCSKMVTKKINVQAKENANFTYSSTNYCPSESDPTPVILGTKGGVFSAAPNGLYLNATTGKISLANSSKGNYAVTYKTPGFCSNVRTWDIIIGDNSSNNLTITSSSGKDIFCMGDSLKLIAQGATKYLWNTGKTDNFITVKNPGKYTVTSKDAGCSATVSFDVKVDTLRLYMSVPSMVLLNNGFVTLNGNPKEGTFSGAGVNTNIFDPKLAGLGTKKIRFSYVSPNKCSAQIHQNILVYDTVSTNCTVTKYDTVKVTKLDTITIKKTIYDTVTITNNVIKYDTVKVTKFDTITITNKVTTYDTVTIKNNVYDTVIITNNVTKYDTITLTDTVSILKIKFKLTTGLQANQMASMSVYPNPTTDVLHIEVGDAKALEGYRYRILDALGKEVYNELVKNTITEIPLKTLGSAGMYQFEVLDQKNVRIQTNKIVLQ